MKMSNFDFSSSNRNVCFDFIYFKKLKFFRLDFSVKSQCLFWFNQRIFMRKIVKYWKKLEGKIYFLPVHFSQMGFIVWVTISWAFSTFFIPITALLLAKTKKLFLTVKQFLITPQSSVSWKLSSLKDVLDKNFLMSYCDNFDNSDFSIRKRWKIMQVLGNDCGLCPLPKPSCPKLGVI